MIKIQFPNVRPSLLSFIKGKKLNSEEMKYANEMINEIRATIDPWEKITQDDAKIIINDIRTEVRNKIAKEKPANVNIRNIEHYAFDVASQHFGVMANPNLQNLLRSTKEITPRIIELGHEYDTCIDARNTIIQLRKNGNISSKIFRQNLSKIEKDIKTLTSKIQGLLEQKKSIIETNEKVAKENGFYDSYDFVYNLPKK